jgi:hypothetical protein
MIGRPGPAEALDLDAGVLAEHPAGRIRDRAAEPRLRQRVVVVRLARLGRVLVGFEELDLPAGERVPQLPKLVLVPRGEAC